MSSHVLGIDTGSTYTDAVLMDSDERVVLSTAKAPTTRNDLCLGIARAIDFLAIPDASKVRLVSVSTTLATNSVVERKNLPVALVLIGYDPDLIGSFRLDRHFAATTYQYFRGGHDVNSEEREPLDLDGIVKWVRECSDRVSAIAVSSYFSPLNPAHENRAHEAIASVTDLPVVLGHQLSSKLDSIQRATTAALNASLIGLVRRFIYAVQQALQERGIVAPLMIVRGDGSLMRAEMAADCALETVVSGPAASAIGGAFLSGERHALVVDMGGTTTDICLVTDGAAGIDAEGAIIGGFRTAVRSAHIRSIGLGGDSIIAWGTDGRLRLGPERVVPLSLLATLHPSVRADLAAARDESPGASAWDLEYWFLPGSEPMQEWAAEPSARELIKLLREAPHSLASLLQRYGLFHPLQMPEALRDLLRRDAIGRAALTPTDLLHITGQFTPWDSQAALSAACVLARRSGRGVDQLIEDVLDHIAERVVLETVQYVSGTELPTADRLPQEDTGGWLLSNAVRPRSEHLAASLRLKCPLVGVGAPAYAFLGRAARILGTDLVLPQHFEVGNAVGAVAASVVVNREARVFHSNPRDPEGGYYVQVAETREPFPDLSTALEHACTMVRRQVLEVAAAAGAAEPEAVVTQIPTGAEEYVVEARAFGNPRLSDGVQIGCGQYSMATGRAV
jgi:N-methylhydantoinase A/oxoprolinase/acetone carboxylase beta subunit